MRRVPLLLLAILPLTTAASAQTVAPFDPARPTMVFSSITGVAAGPEIVVARLMTFDRDNDGRIVKSELPERMQNLLAADTSGDQALDRTEILALASPAPAFAAAATTAPGFRGGGGGYTFGDQVSLSTRAHVEGALDDLRLPPVTHQNALAIVRPFMTRLEADATTVLVKELEGLMSPGQLGSFKVMLERRMTGQGTPAVFRTNGTKVNFVRFGPDLAQMIEAFALPVDHTKAALAAFDGFKERIRPAAADRAALVGELKDVLSDEERENFDAALQRRPLIKANGLAGVVSGVVGRDVIHGVVEGPAVFRTPRQVAQP